MLSITMIVPGVTRNVRYLKFGRMATWICRVKGKSCPILLPYTYIQKIIRYEIESYRYYQCFYIILMVLYSVFTRPVPVRNNSLGRTFWCFLPTYHVFEKSWDFIFIKYKHSVLSACHTHNWIWNIKYIHYTYYKL